jgi:hypothetical protein
MKKICCQCHTEKDISEFYKSRNRKDGHSATCKTCEKQYRLTHTEEKKKYNRQYCADHAEELKKRKNQYYVTHIDEFKKRHKQYQIDHADEIKRKAKQYQINHADEIREKTKQYQIRHADKIRRRKKQYHLNHLDKLKKHSKQYYKDNADEFIRYRKEHREHILLNSYKRIDKKKGFVCDLTVDWLKENITSKPCHYCGSTDRIGCDRIDNAKGHAKNNVLPSCWICNGIRGDIFTVEEMCFMGQTKKVIFDSRANRSIFEPNKERG